MKLVWKQVDIDVTVHRAEAPDGAYQCERALDRLGGWTVFFYDHTGDETIDLDRNVQSVDEAQRIAQAHASERYSVLGYGDRADTFLVEAKVLLESALADAAPGRQRLAAQAALNGVAVALDSLRDLRDTK